MWKRYFKMQTVSLSPVAKQYMRDYAYPLFAAVHKKNLAVFKELVEYDSGSVLAVDDTKTPILCEVFAWHDLEMAKILLENGADPDAMVPFLKPPRLLLVEVVIHSDMEFISLLIEYGASVDKEEKGLSVRKVLDSPQQYVRQLFDGHEQCRAARQFLAKVEEMKQLVDRLRPRSTTVDETPLISVVSPTSSAINQLRQRSLVSPALEATSLSPAIPVI